MNELKINQEGNYIKKFSMFQQDQSQITKQCFLKSNKKFFKEASIFQKEEQSCREVNSCHFKEKLEVGEISIEMGSSKEAAQHQSDN